MRPLLASLGLAAALAFTPTVAEAQPADAEGAAEEARRHFEIGASLFLEENYEGALAEFEESYAIRAVPVVAFNIAQTLRRLQRYDEAIDAYRLFLRTADELPAEERQAVRSAIRELSRAIGEVTVRVDVDGAEVRVDGRAVGTTPLSGPLRLAAGTRELVVERSGYVPLREEVRVVGGEARELTLQLAREDTAGTLAVTANVEGAGVRIDGVDVGVAPVERRLGSGGHEVEVRADGYETFRREVVLAAQQERRLYAELEVERALTERWWFWTAIGGGVVALVAIVAIAAVAAGSGEEQPVSGTLGTVEALTW